MFLLTMCSVYLIIASLIAFVLGFMSARKGYISLTDTMEDIVMFSALWIVFLFGLIGVFIGGIKNEK